MRKSAEYRLVSLVSLASALLAIILLSGSCSTEHCIGMYCMIIIIK